jgi:mannose-6-phosphate isomerase-like protein (cupin superfamily)
VNDLIDLINKSRLDKKILVIKDYTDLNISWDYIVNEIDESMKSKDVSELGDSLAWKKENGLMIRDLFYMMLTSPFPTNNENINNIAHKFSKILLNKDIYPLPRICYFINLVSKNKNINSQPTAPAHVDNYDAIFIQLIGKTAWKSYLDEKSVSPNESQIVQPGDIIFIPKGVYHEVDSLLPRAGIQISFPINNI